MCRLAFGPYPRPSICTWKRHLHFLKHNIRSRSIKSIVKHSDCGVLEAVACKPGWSGTSYLKKSQGVACSFCSLKYIDGKNFKISTVSFLSFGIKYIFFLRSNLRFFYDEDFTSSQRWAHVTPVEDTTAVISRICHNKS